MPSATSLIWVKCQNDDAENIVVVGRDDAIIQYKEYSEKDKCVKCIMLACDDFFSMSQMKMIMKMKA